MRYPPWAPEPPFEMPPARTIRASGRGELFVRDTGGRRPPVMLLHGWMATADLNWFAAYGDLVRAGYRVIAIDHRGHGRGLRTVEPFTLADCAADAAAALRRLDVAPAAVVGYSMGGAIAQLLARDHPDVVSGLVLSGTAQHWQDKRSQRSFKAMGVIGLALSLAPVATWQWGFRQLGLGDGPRTAWMQSELMRHSVRDLVAAGRSFARFDSQPWLNMVHVPTAVVITSRDEAVAPRRQRRLAEALGAEVFEVPIKHLEIVSRGSEYNPVLLQALASVGAETKMNAA